MSNAQQHEASVSVTARRFESVGEAGRDLSSAPMRDANDLLTGSMEYEAVVVSLRSGEALRVHHELDRINPLAHRRGHTRFGGRGRPYSETSRNHSGSNGKQGDPAHLSSPVQSAQDGGSSLFDGEQCAGP